MRGESELQTTVTMGSGCVLRRLKSTLLVASMENKKLKTPGMRGLGGDKAPEKRLSMGGMVE